MQVTVEKKVHTTHPFGKDGYVSVSAHADGSICIWIVPSKRDSATLVTLPTMKDFDTFLSHLQESRTALQQEEQHGN